MRNRFYPSNIVNILIVGAIICITIVGIPTLAMSLSSWQVTIALLSLTMLHGIAMSSHTLTSYIYRTGYARAAMLVAWVLFGLVEGALVAVIGTLIAVIINYVRGRDVHSWSSVQDYLADCSSHLLVSYGLYFLLIGNFDRPMIYDSVYLLIIALIAGSATSLFINYTTHNLNPMIFATHGREYFLQEFAVIVIALVFPLIFIELSPVIFVSLVALVIVQIGRHIQVIRTETKLKARINEISALNTMGTRLSQHLTLATTLETVYQEVTQVIDATKLYIAIYDDENQTLDYQLLVIDGKNRDYPKQPVSERTIQSYVINHKEPIFSTRNKLIKSLRTQVNSNQLFDVSYMVVPLVVSGKMVGVMGAHHRYNTQAFSNEQFDLFKAIGNQATLAIRNAILYDKTVNLADKLSVINQSLQTFMVNFDYEQALYTACELALELTGANKSAIYLLPKNDDDALYLAKSIGFDGLNIAQTKPYKRYRLTSEAEVWNDVTQTDNEELIQQAEDGNYSASLEIPLQSGTANLGILVVFHDEPHYYDAPEVNLLRMLANQVTSALDNADLLDALELYAAEQAQLVHLSHLASGTLDLDEIIVRISGSLKQIVDATRVDISLWDGTNGVLSIENAAEDLSYAMTVNTMPEIRQFLTSEALQKTIIVHSDNVDASEQLKRLMVKNGIKTVALVPMYVDKAFIGILLVANDKKREFSENELRLIDMANNQVATQIQNARIHKITQQELASRLEQLQLIEVIAQQISQVLDSDLVIESILTAALQVTQADFASVALKDENHENHYRIISREIVDGMMKPDYVELTLEGGTLQNVINTGQPVLIADNTQNEQYMSPIITTERFKSSLGVPMISGNNTIGMLSLESKKYNFFSEEQATFINSLAGHAAISIDNARLIEEREQRIITLDSLRELSLQALGVINQKGIYNAVLQTTQIMLQAKHVAIYRYEGDDLTLISQTAATHHLDSGYDLDERYIVQAITDSRTTPTILQDNAQRTWAIIPIQRRQVIQEIICTAFDAPVQVVEEYLYTIELIASQVAGHLENAALNEAITTSNNRMRAILDSTDEGIILLNQNGQIQEANLAAHDLTHIDLKTEVMRPLYDVDTSALDAQKQIIWERILEAYSALREGEDEQILTFGEQTNNQEALLQLCLSLTNVVSDTGDIAGHLLIIRDTTEEKILQDFREQMQSMVLHDLRGPLTAMVTSMYVAENMLDIHTDQVIDPYFNETIQTSLESAEEMLRMVDTLRDLPMLNKMQIERELASLHVTAEKAYQLLASNFKEVNINVTLDIPEDMLLCMDTNLIRRVFVNLLHNAFKFTPENGEILVWTVPDADENFVRVQVADTGPGIPEEDRHRIFEQFEQVQQRKPRAGGKGMGIGLTFCQLAIETHEGQIWVEEDSPLSGACFAFRIPKKLSDPAIE